MGEADDAKTIPNDALQIYWQPWAEPGLEHLVLAQTAEGFLANGLILRVRENIPFRAQYQIRCDPQWRVREVTVQLLPQNDQAIMLQSDGRGHWTDAAGLPLPVLEGCSEVDISLTPFTNTLPIRRLRLQPGHSAELAVAYVAVPEMQVRPVQQRYTCLEAGSPNALYKYEGLSSHFTANLPVDAQGLVMDYPGVFRRVWPR